MRAALLALAALACGCASGPAFDGPFDLVIRGGRVMDPESGLDAVRNVGIAGGVIRSVTAAPLRGARTIDARGLVVAPGFIDLHSHGQDPANYAMKAADGVTCALELEVGTADVDAWYAEREGKALVHFGVSIGHIPVRMKVMGDAPAFLPPADAKACAQEATDAEVAAMKERIDQGLRRGAVAVGFGIQYTAAASRWEILEMFRVASQHGASCHVHLRHNGVKEPRNSTAALEEVLAAAAVTGAPLHVVHIHSTSVSATPRHLAMIAEARSRGLDATTECYPYPAGMTKLNSGVFKDDWRGALGIDYKDIQWVATGERLTVETYAKYREQDGYVLVFSIPESAVTAAVSDPTVMIASDGIWEEGKGGHPRGAGACARVLGKFVREEKVLSLMDALRKMTILPARRLERAAPMFTRKGRVQEGCDADLTVFDPARVIDRATYEKPTLPSEGIAWVLVGGTPVVEDGKLQAGIKPGKPLRAAVRD